MRVIADLHIHSRYSRATSKKLTPPCLERWARIKGISLLGSGDCTHPLWLAELRECLEDAEEGFYTLKQHVRDAFNQGPAFAEELPDLPAAPHIPEQKAPLQPRFVLSGEISTIYKYGGRTRKVHHLVILPDFKAAALFQTKLEQNGNIRSDGRPILGLDSRDLLEILLEADSRAMLIPAHIWTPWFSALGARSGFDSIDECYRDLAPYITAIETGLSSNPPMNWALPSLNRFSVISNSDAHSPDKLGREATIFDMDLSYSSLARSLSLDEGGAGKPGIAGTVEFFPQEGKYHYDGHRKCGIYLSPEEAAPSDGGCPVCGKALTPGVMGRVMELVRRPVDEGLPCPASFYGTNQRPYHSLIPLAEICAELLGTGPASKKVSAAYSALIQKAGSELSILMDMPLGDMEKISCPGIPGELLASAIGSMRAGTVSISPGYDGEYGSIRVLPDAGRGSRRDGAGLFGDCEDMPPARRMPKRAKYVPPEKPEITENATAEDGAEIPRRDSAEEAGKHFTQDQERAVFHNEPYSIIIAGPGTGKTAVLAARIARIVREKSGQGMVLALSFTVRAAQELKERALRESGGEEAGNVQTATFHSFCAALLREKASAAGLSKNFKILGDSERTSILKDILVSQNTGPGNRKVSFRELERYIESRKRFLLLPDDRGERSWRGLPETLKDLARSMDSSKPLPEAETAYGLYRERLKSLSALDYDDLIAGTVRLLAARNDILLDYRRRFTAVLVDEYQDLNFAQYALVRLLAPDRGEAPSPKEGTPELCVIGDPNQAIYGFRGSDKGFIDRFLIDYPRALRLNLTKSFRCAEPIMHAAGRLIDVSLEGSGNAVSLFRAEYPTEKAEAEGIARRISALIGGTSFFAIDSGIASGEAESEAGGGEICDPAECAVLLRSSALAPALEKAFKDHGIPYRLNGDKPWWEEEPLQSFLVFLKGNVHRFTEQPAGLIIISAWEEALNAGLIPGKKRKAIPEEVQYLADTAALYGDIQLLLDTLSGDFSGELPGRENRGVHIMTIHASKGLEFDHVFIPGLEEGILPFTLFDEKEDPDGSAANRAEEERRILYVAMTRSRTGLYLSRSRTRMFRGRKLTLSPSRYLDELEKIIPLRREQGEVKRDPQLKLF
ncbi:UvrD-helicase domain-containing protein [Treponema sp. OttesenSCG-928-L16]|nr:UvrD-helicase domain-containing protein [Treponema sp. OttesenSCG-928-L16]